MVATVARIWISLLVACALVLALGDCGGSAPEEPASQEADTGLSEEQREQSERAAVADQVPEADRLAYYQVATASGLLRAWAQAVSSGREPPARAGDAELRDAEQRLAELDAEDPGLERLAGRLLSESDAINAGLQRYVRRNPVISVLLPD
jgi:hypothetical protein